ncbi:MAG: AMIN domain-containing protein [Nitrospira sp.]|nr:AMIN domain-containing protein [Nitrospira sp.]
MYKISSIAISFFVFMTAVSFAASVPKIYLRAWDHSVYLRIVIEGSEQIISKVIIKQENENINVEFSGSKFDLQKGKFPISYKVHEERIVFETGRSGPIKSFSLKNPSRMVIDIYNAEAEGKVKESKSKPKNQPAKTAVKEKKPEPAKKLQATVKAEVMKSADIKTLQISIEADKDDSFIIDQYKDVWEMLQRGNFYQVIKALEIMKPVDQVSLAVHHYIQAEAQKIAGKPLEAITHYRLAYIYGSDKELKQRALIKRASLYLKHDLIQEAAADFIFFIREFPDSQFMESAELGIAESLAVDGYYVDSIKHYANAGDSTAAMFGKANALQQLGQIRDARIAYASALRIDPKYPERDPETYFYIGENMRLAGELKQARMHLSAMYFGRYRDMSFISLGHISMKESLVDDAIRSFNNATKSRFRKVRIEGHYQLAKAYLVKDDKENAIKHYEIIMINYIDSFLHRDVLLQLASLYRKNGNFAKSVGVIKELLYGDNPSAAVFSELETTLLESGAANSSIAGAVAKTSDIKVKDGEEVLEKRASFVQLWNEVDIWMIDVQRIEFLIKIADMLRYEGQPFIALSQWLVENTTGESRAIAALKLAEYYIAMGDIENSNVYMQYAKGTLASQNVVHRVEAKTNQLAGRYSEALGDIMLVQGLDKTDLEILRDIIRGLINSESDQVSKGIDFYESVISASAWEAEEYSRLADVLYENSLQEKALKYYRVAFKKKPDDNWIAYRLGLGSKPDESKVMYEKLQKGNELLNRLAKSKLMEMSLLNKVDEVY